MKEVAIPTPNLSPETGKFLPAKELRRLLNFAETHEHFIKAIDILSRPQAELGLEPPKPETLAEVKRFETDVAGRYDEMTGNLSPEQKRELQLLLEKRQAHREDAEREFAEFLQKENGTNWKEPLAVRLEYKKSHPIDTRGVWTEEGITPEEIQECLKLEDDSNHLMHTVNNMKSIWGFGGSMEGLGLEPISGEAAEDLNNVWRVFIAQENSLHGKMTESQRIMSRRLSDYKWGSRRVAEGRFHQVFAQETGEPFYEPIEPEPNEEAQTEVAPETKRQVYERACPQCGTTFKSTHETGACYDCTLDAITHGLGPEEGDFNSAAIMSGTLTEEEERYLQQDLASVEVL